MSESGEFCDFTLSVDDFLNLDQKVEGFVELEIDPSIFDEELPCPESPVPSTSSTTLNTTEIPDDNQTSTGNIRHEIDRFIADQENLNTRRKTLSDIKKLEIYMSKKGEKREMHDIPMSDLDTLIAGFLLSLKKPDGTDYEPSSIRNMISSFDRKLRRQGYEHSILRCQTNAFNLTKETLKAKMKLLKKSGKGNRPQEAEPLTDEDINLLYEKNLLGVDSPSALINTLWLNNCLHFGMRGVKEHYELRWGDVTLKRNDHYEYLELNERQTKTRTGENAGDARKVKPKLFSNKTARDPVEAYKKYAEKRPQNFCFSDSPFYIAPRTIPVGNETDQWFFRQRIGMGKLSGLMKNMCEKADISRKLTNHSARKHLVQKLRDKNVPPTEIIQISGHKNIQSVMNYSSISIENQKKCSNILSTTSNDRLNIPKENSLPGPSTSEISPQNEPVLSVPLSNEAQSEVPAVMPMQRVQTPFSYANPVTPVARASGQHEVQIPTFNVSTSNTSVITPMFYGAVLNIGTLNVYPNTN